MKNQRKDRCSGKIMGFTLIEIAIVLAIISIFLAITALPSYNNYASRKKVAAAIESVWEIKLLLSTYCSIRRETLEYDRELLDSNFVQILGKKNENVKSVNLEGTCETPIIVIRTKDTGGVADPVIEIRGNWSKENSLQFTCAPRVGLPLEVPSACRRKT